MAVPGGVQRENIKKCIGFTSNLEKDNVADPSTTRSSKCSANVMPSNDSAGHSGTHSFLMTLALGAPKSGYIRLLNSLPIAALRAAPGGSFGQRSGLLIG